GSGHLEPLDEFVRRGPQCFQQVPALLGPLRTKGVENGKISVVGVGCVCDPVDGGGAAIEMVRKTAERGINGDRGNRKVRDSTTALCRSVSQRRTMSDGSSVGGAASKNGHQGRFCLS
ncbi:MAG: hypothetical protein OXC53_10140, partial [Rhodobacteraceae bacterium]|nr:hypothetical protein [Paracoccaceae bacterium]